MIISIGTDIIEINRFSKKLNPRFIQRVFSSSEQDYLQDRSSSSTAEIFAAKEAVAKALGTGFFGFWPCDIEIVHDVLGKPHVRLHGKAFDIAKHLARKYYNTKQKKKHNKTFCIKISVSHSSDIAIATAIILQINSTRR